MKNIGYIIAIWVLNSLVLVTSVAMFLYANTAMKSVIEIKDSFNTPDVYTKVVIVNSQTGNALAWANELIVKGDRYVVTNPRDGKNSGSFGMCYTHLVEWSKFKN